MKTALYGAIIGDMVGSPYEGRSRAIKTKNFELFSEYSHFTDDSVLTVAVAEALLCAGTDDDDTIRRTVIGSMKAWGRKYIHAGYSRSFKQWLMQDDSLTYPKFSNASAMRVSSAGWLFDTMEHTRQVARLTAEVSHNTPEGIRGAQSVASAKLKALQFRATRRGKSHTKKAIAIFTPLANKV